MVFEFDDDVVRLVGDLAERLGTTEQLAVRSAVEAELKRLSAETNPHEKLAALLQRFPKPNPEGRSADKAFYDDLAGEFD